MLSDSVRLSYFTGAGLCHNRNAFHWLGPLVQRIAYSAKTRAAGDSIKPGGVSPGNGQKELTKPVERATADRNTRPVIATSVARCRGLIVLN